jgi:hypothetical protein
VRDAASANYIGETLAPKCGSSLFAYCQS